MNSDHGAHDRTRYQGRNLAYLLLAIVAPAGLLYLRLVLGLIATDSRISPAQATALKAGSSITLVLFFVVQLGSAFYLQRLVAASKSWIGQVLRYLTVLALGVFFSVTGMTILEAFGLNFFLRANAGR